MRRRGASDCVYMSQVCDCRDDYLVKVDQFMNHNIYIVRVRASYGIVKEFRG